MTVYSVGSGRITTTRTLETEDYNHSVSNQEGVLLKESGGHLELYLPLDEAELQIANTYFLPNGIIKFLELSEEQHALITTILYADHDNLDRVLDLEGITSREAIEKELETELKDDGNHSGTDSALVKQSYCELTEAIADTASQEEPDVTPRRGADTALIESRLSELTISPDKPPAPSPPTATDPTATVLSAAIETDPAIAPSATPAAAPLQQTPITVPNPFAKPSTAEIESTTSGLSSRIDIIARSARTARLPASNVVSLAQRRPAVSGEPAEPSSVHPSTPARPTSNARADPSSTRTPKSSRSAIRTDAQRVRDFSIGFQGELYVSPPLSLQPPISRKAPPNPQPQVFELLKPHLPSFTAEENWTSGLREYARANPDYAHISAYTAREKSDLTYDDTQGRLTQLLLEKGLAQVEAWLETPPTYYLEVKTTTEEAHVPFYMSKGQHRLAKKLAVVEGEVPTKVYVIMRVSKIQEEDPGLTIYLDPWALQQRGMLEFVAESYAVTPGHGGA